MSGKKRSEADHWDAIDVSALSPPEVEVIGSTPSGPLAATVAIRLDAETMKSVRLIAKQRKVGYTSLLRSWIIERLASEISGDPRDDEVRSRVARTIATQVPELIDEVTRQVLKELGEEP